MDDTINIPGYGDTTILNDYIDSVKASTGVMICTSDTKPSEVMNHLRQDLFVILIGDYQCSSYIMNYVHHYENELSDRRDIETRRTRKSRLCFIARENCLVDVSGLPSDIDFVQWLDDDLRSNLYLLPLRRLERILTDIRRAEEGISYDFLDSKIYIKPFVYVPSDESVPLMYMKYIDMFRDKSVIDMGTGTGILALLAAQSGATRVVGVDINPLAVACAENNVAKTGFSDFVTMIESNLFDNIDGQFDVIIFNAPWVQGKIVNVYEQAIYDSEFSVLKQFIATAGMHLTPDGIILLQFSDISQQTDGSMDILYEQLELHGFSITDSTSIKRRNRLFGRIERVYLFEIHQK